VWKGRRVVIAYDSDIVQKPNVQRARRQLAIELQKRGAQLGYLEWKPAQAKGIDDLLAAIGPEPVLQMFEAVDFRKQRWREELIVNNHGDPRRCWRMLSRHCDSRPSGPAYFGIVNSTPASTPMPRRPLGRWEASGPTRRTG
jgi:hypothetical protein